MPSSLEKTLALRVRAVAAARSLPLSHVADRAGVARSHLWAVLKTERSATLSLVQRLAEALGVAPIELLTDAKRAGEETGRPAAKRRR